MEDVDVWNSSVCVTLPPVIVPYSIQQAWEQQILKALEDIMSKVGRVLADYDQWQHADKGGQPMRVCCGTSIKLSTGMRKEIIRRLEGAGWKNVSCTHEGCVRHLEDVLEPRLSQPYSITTFNLTIPLDWCDGRGLWPEPQEETRTVID